MKNQVVKVFDCKKDVYFTLLLNLLVACSKMLDVMAEENMEKLTNSPGAIVDASSWIALSILNLCHCLPVIFGEVYMPEVVKMEILKGGRNSPGYQELDKLSWLKVCGVSQRQYPVFPVDMDQGETDVLRLACEKGIGVVMLDERLARIYAGKMNIKVIGVLGFLVMIKKEGLIGEIKEYISALKESGIWIGENIEREALVLAGEQDVE